VPIIEGYRIQLARGAVVFSMADGYTSNEFQAVRKARVARRGPDRVYLRPWTLRWVDDCGHIRRDAEPLPDQGA
jgi:hypothetical protein